MATNETQSSSPDRNAADPTVSDGLVCSFDVSADGTLMLDAELGSIEVRTGERDEVRVSVQGQARDCFGLSHEQCGNNVRVEAERHLSAGGRRVRWRDHRVCFLVDVPERYNLDLVTNRGNISITDLVGNVECRTGGGSIRMGDVDGEVRCRTSGGSIALGKIGKSVVARTSGGSIAVDAVDGPIDANTCGGNVSARISSQPDSDCQLSTSGGTITMALDPSMSADLNAKTNGGRIDVDFPVEGDGGQSRQRLKAKLNGGGPELRLRTSGGNVRIRHLE